MKSLFMMDVRNSINLAAHSLMQAGSLTPRLDAEVLLASSLRTDRLGLYKEPERLLNVGEQRLYKTSIRRRAAGEPVAYITGVKEFWSLLFSVNADVLVPRPETEVLVEEVLSLCNGLTRQDCRILEIGTGSGAIAVALAKELPRAVIMATDISPGALRVAQKNAQMHGVDKRISFLLGDLYEPLAHTLTFDVIVSNPPYISAWEFDNLPREIKDFEPRTALFAGVDGLDLYRRIISGGGRYLRTGGWLTMEMGSGQRLELIAMLSKTGDYDPVVARTDYGGTERVVKARKK